jgi:hypothetical protein
MQWLQNMYAYYKITYDPFVKNDSPLVPDHIDGSKVTSMPPADDIVSTKYRSMDLDILTPMCDWLLWRNPSSRMNLLLLWMIISWNNFTNFCTNGTLYRQMCKQNCLPCRKRSTVVDIHEVVRRSGYAYGILSSLLEHIYFTGTKVSFIKNIIFV